MSQQTLDQLLAKLNEQEAAIDSIATSVTNIDADIDVIKENLPTSGGLTEAEVATLSAALDNVKTKTTAVKDAVAALDAENPEAGTEG